MMYRASRLTALAAPDRALVRNSALRIRPDLLAASFVTLFSVADAAADPLEQSTAEERSTPLFSAAEPDSGTGSVGARW